MKRNTSRRRLGFALAVLMLATAFSATACGSADDDAQTTTATPIFAAETTTVPAETTESPYDANGYLKDELPDDLSFSGEIFNILGWQHTVPEFAVSELTGDIVNDSIFDRDRTVEERLGVKLEHEVIPGNSSTRTDFCNTVMNSVNAGAQAYDAIGAYGRSAGMLTVNRMLVDLVEVEYLDFDKPWWPKSLLELNTFYGKLYYASGDISPTMLYQTMMMIYNTKLGTDLGLENPQQLAIDGKWTLDKMLEMSANVYQDLDNNGTKSAADQYGLFSFANANLDIFFIGSDLIYVEPNRETGMLEMSDKFFSEKTISLTDKLNSLFYNGNDGYYSASGKVSDNGFNSLFYNTLCSTLADTFRASEMEYSVLPAPKLDENQENYRTCLAATHTLYCVPLDAPNLDMTGAVLECMASEGYRKTTPAIFETAFKYKYAQNENDSAIFDIIRSNVVFDVSRPFYDSIGGSTSSPTIVWRNQIVKNVNQLASTAKTYSKLWANTLADLCENLKG